MEKISFVRKIEPTTIEVEGVEVRLLFTMGAAAEMEDVFAQPYLQTVSDMLQIPMQKGGPLTPPLSIEQQAILISILAKAAGQELTVAALTELPMVAFTQLAQAAQGEIVAKTPWMKDSAGKKV